jgi:hypothetical protein
MGEQVFAKLTNAHIRCGIAFHDSALVVAGWWSCRCRRKEVPDECFAVCDTGELDAEANAYLVAHLEWDFEGYTVDCEVEVVDRGDAGRE